MYKSVSIILKTYIEMPENEQREFREELNKYENAPLYKKHDFSRSVKESSEKLMSGPLSGGRCLCCVRG